MRFIISVQIYKKILKKEKRINIYNEKVIVYMNTDKIIKECINSVIGKKMLREYKDPNDAQIVRTCADTLQELHDRVVTNGMSKREITVEHIQEIVNALRNLEKMMS
jgi:hypothetical protein